ncbi:MAG TPA: flagellar hook-length control protein FliK [Burkholderiaceae bacterium]|nr:flagellar hook-length control protein FliK [Rhodoferax sp.]HQX58175.1 flagellar hook-length control protein FliK [Burkholderiaceae bacterium]HQZ06892.1 flagellar hook-length control protein FliK [Burkholderiaceae bacterium]
MSIEIRPPAAPSNPVGKSSADAGRTRANGTQGDGDAAAVSFLSLLGAMGEGLPNPLASAAGATAADAGLAEAQRTAAVLVNDTVLTGVPVPAALASVQLPADGKPAALPGANHPSAGGRWTGVQGGGPATGQQQMADEAAPLVMPSGGGNDTQSLQQLAADSALGQTDKPAPTASPRDFAARVEAARTAAEAVVAAPQAGSQAGAVGNTVAPQFASMFDVSAAGLRTGGSPQRNQERLQARSSAPGTSPGFVAWGDATPAGTSHGASAVYAPGAMTPAPATAMAEKMHYWVSRGVQSAALQLDAFGGGTVDVSIAVKGDSAVVEFRTDQPQARQMLLDAMPQLKELLAGEGLMLSGGFVGGSTQQDTQSRHRDGQSPGARSVTMVSTPEPVTGRPAPVGATAGASVDLFV